MCIRDGMTAESNSAWRSAQDAKPMLDACALLQAEFDAAVILVHHTGVSDEAQHRARGSSAWRGALDIEVSIIPGTDERPIELVQRKSKDAELIKSAFARLETVTLPWLDEDGENVTTAVLQPDDAPIKTGQSRGESAARKRFEGALIHAGIILSDGAIYISAQDWHDAYATGIGSEDGKVMTKEGARKRVQRDKKALQEAGITQERDGGYILAEGQDRDIMAIIMKYSKNNGL